jgi:uncharacterized damage-inducible protein DinB
MLDESIPMYGEPWKRGFVLSALIGHQTHHRAQMTVLMRRPGCGSRESTAPRARNGRR